MRVASEEKGKVRKGFYIEEGVLEQIDIVGAGRCEIKK